MLYVGLGHAEGLDTAGVVQQAIDDCRSQLNGRRPQAAIVLAGPQLDHTMMLAIINESFPGIHLVGCSTAGNFSSFHGVSDDAVTLTLLASEEIRFSSGCGREVSQNLSQAVQQAAATGIAGLDGPPKVCLTFPYGYGYSFENSLAELDKILGPDCPVFGGVAGTLWEEKQDTCQFYGHERLEDSLPILLMTGPVQAHFSIANSWRPVGRRARIGKSDDRRVYQIGGFPAVDYYRNYLGFHETPAREFILAVYPSAAQENFITAPLEYHDDGSITFTSHVPEGAEVQLTEAARQELINDTRATSSTLSKTLGNWRPAIALNFSCAFRKTILGTAVDKELDALQETLPSGLPMMGFFSFGEISPLHPGGASLLHGATLITLLLGPGPEQYPLPIHSRQDSPAATALDERQQLAFTERRLVRATSARKHLESLHEFTAQMHHRMMMELEEARQQIQDQKEQLHESEEKFRRIVQTAGQGFVLMDEALSIIEANAAFCGLIQEHPDAITSKSLLDFVPREERSLFSTIFHQLQEDAHQRFEGTLTANNDLRVPVQVNSNILRNDAGQLIGHMAFFADLTDQKKALALAGEVQKSLLPQSVPQIRGLDIAGKNVSCDEVGGDYYDFFLQQDQGANALSVAVGDITGHGVDAALLMSSARAFLRLHVSQAGSISEIVAAMNNNLVDDVQETGRFMSLFYLAIDADLTSLEWVRAGHDPAILLHTDDESVEDLKGPGVVLGVARDYEYQVNHSPLRNGDIIAVGTDGIWETTNNDGEMFGRNRFIELLQSTHQMPAATILSTVFHELGQFRGDKKADDDTTLVIIKVSSGESQSMEE